MKATFIISLLLPVFSFAQEWNHFIDEDSLFTIDIPGVIQSKQKSVLTGIYDLEVRSYFSDRSKTEEDNFLYLINVADYPEGSFPSDSLDLIKSFLEESILSLEMNLNGKVEYQIDTNSPLQGIKARINQKHKDTIIKVFVMISDDRFYTLQVFTFADKSLNDGIDMFLNSFRLL